MPQFAVPVQTAPHPGCPNAQLKESPKRKWHRRARASGTIVALLKPEAVIGLLFARVDNFQTCPRHIDKWIIAKAAASPRKEDTTLLWFCRPSGTHCFRERIVFLKGTAPHNTWRLYKRPRLAYAIGLTGEERGKIKGKEWIFPSPFSANSRQSPERPPAAVFIRTSGPGAAPLVDELNDLPDLLTALQ